jgi:hypothetical protein
MMNGARHKAKDRSLCFRFPVLSYSSFRNVQKGLPGRTVLHPERAGSFSYAPNLTGWSLQKRTQPFHYEAWFRKFFHKPMQTLLNDTHLFVHREPWTIIALYPFSRL